MTTESAALPWGIPSKPVDPSLIKNVPENMKLDIGTARIEVKWILSSEEDDDGASDSFVTKWWPATISRVSEDGKTDGEGRVAFILCYDADAEFGYEEPTEHMVTFLNEHELFDFGEVDLLQWRHAGSDWDAIPSWENQNPEKTEDGKTIVTMREVLEKADRINKCTGTTIREDLANSMQDMPMEAQRIFADRIATDMGVFGEELRALMASKDGEVIQMEDVQEMLVKFKKRTGGAEMNGSM